MKDKIEWVDSPTIVLKITDLSVSYSYSERREPTNHKCYDHISIIGKVIFSEYKNIKKDDELELLSIVNHDDEIPGLDEKICIEENGETYSTTIRKFREKNSYKIVGSISKWHKSITTDDRFWDRYMLMKMHNKDIYLNLDCRREKRKRDLKIVYYNLSTKFDITDYE